MAADVTFDGTLIRIVLTDTITAADLHFVIERALQLESDLSVTPDRLIDTSAATSVGLSFSAVAGILKVRRTTPPRNAIRSAIVAVNAVQQGYARMFQTLNDHPLITIRLFDNHAEAEAWLETPR